MAVIASVLLATGAAYALLGGNDPAAPGNRNGFFRDGHDRVRGRGGRYPHHRSRSAPCPAMHRGRRRDRRHSRRRDRHPVSAVVGRARDPARRRHLVPQSRELHGRHRLDDRRRNPAGQRGARDPRFSRRLAGLRDACGLCPVRRDARLCAVQSPGGAAFPRRRRQLAARSPRRLAASAGRGARAFRRRAAAPALLSRRRDGDADPAPHAWRARLAGASHAFLSARDRQRTQRAGRRRRVSCSSMSVSWPSRSLRSSRIRGRSQSRRSPPARCWSGAFLFWLSRGTK